MSTTKDIAELQTDLLRRAVERLLKATEQHPQWIARKMTDSESGQMSTARALARNALDMTEPTP